MRTIFKTLNSFEPERLFVPVCTAILISLTYLLYHFNDGGNLHDAGVYFESGKLVLLRENPYSISDFGPARWGSFGPVPFTLFLTLVPEGFRALVVRAVSLIGILLFLRIFFTKLGRTQISTIFLVVIWTSPVRELLVTNQMVGIEMGIIALSVYLWQKSENTKNIWLGILASFFFVIAIDLKPHLSLVFFVAFTILMRTSKIFWVTVIEYVLLHTLVDLSQKRILEIDWLASISSLNKSANTNSLGDSLSFWPILNNYLKLPEVFYLLAICITVFLTLLCFYQAQKREWEHSLFLSFFVPSTFIYFHFYDAVPLCAIFVVYVSKNFNLQYSTFALSFILIPKEFLVPRNIILLLSILLIFLFKELHRSKLSHLPKILLKMFSGLLFTLMLHIFNRSLHLSDHLFQSLIVTESLLLILFTFLNAEISIKKHFS